MTEPGLACGHGLGQPGLPAQPGRAGAERQPGPGSGSDVDGPAQWTVVYLLHERRASTASELARVVGTDVTACWRLVGRLTEKDYVARGADRTDRRIVRLRLTPTAVERYPARRAVVAATVARLLDGVATADLPVLNRALVRIVSNGAAAPAIPPAIGGGGFRWRLVTRS